MLNHICNLRCSYCSIKRELTDDNVVASDDHIDDTISYIKGKQTSVSDDKVVFFGGEPLLSIERIERFIRKSKELSLQYFLYTNGTLLDKLHNHVVENLDAMFISIDGSKESHEKHRGVGTFDKIISNVRNIKSYNNDVKLIARITLEEDADVYTSVINLIDDFDAVHWQIVNKPHFDDPDTFILRYSRQIEKLGNMWLENLRLGRMLNIVPFQGIVGNLIFNGNLNNSFLCGTGRHLETIDLDGSIYWCDELLGIDTGVSGNIQNKGHKVENETHCDIFEDCRLCDVSNLCLGRCKKSLKYDNADQIRRYCQLTKILIHYFVKNKSEMSDLIKSKFTKNDLFSIAQYTEIIP